MFNKDLKVISSLLSPKESLPFTNEESNLHEPSAQKKRYTQFKDHGKVRRNIKNI